MEVLDKDGDLVAWCSDDPEDWFRLPPREAIHLLTLKYIEQCGVSLGLRTLYYRAAEEWQELLSQSEDDPLAEQAAELSLHQLMPLICEEYDPEIYDDYGITDLSDDELWSLAEKVRPDLDDPTDEALRLLLFLIQVKRNKG